MPEDTGDDLMKQALQVSSDSDAEENKGPPMDGMAYLKQVVKERKRIAQTVVAEIAPEKIKKSSVMDTFAGDCRSKPCVPAEFKPCMRWQNRQISEFSDFRMKVSRHRTLLMSSKEKPVKPMKFPARDSEMLWCLFCFGNDLWTEITRVRQEKNGETDPNSTEAEIKEGEQSELLEDIRRESKEGTPPNLRVVTNLPVNLVERVLEYQVSWLQTTGWKPVFGPWLFSLLTRIEKPLSPDLGSVLRDLVLFCSQERARLAKEIELKPVNEKSAKENEKNAGDIAEDEELAHDPDIAAFNLFICIVSRYFNQGDLADSDY